MVNDPDTGVFISPDVVERMKKYQSARLSAMRAAPTGRPIAMSPQGNVDAQFKRGGMAHSAKAAAAQGRNGDDTLLHVSRKELGGIESLLKKPLTTNPQTGMPEAFGWSDILPIMASVAATSFLGPEAGPAAYAATAGGAAGATKMLTGGSLQEGLMSGLMAGGGAGIMSNLAEAGAGAAIPTTAAAPVANTAMSMAPDVASMIPGAEGSAMSQMTPMDGTSLGRSASMVPGTNPTMLGSQRLGDAYVGAQQPNALWNAAKSPYGMAAGIGAMGSYMNANPATLPPGITGSSSYKPLSPYQRKAQFPGQYNPNQEYNYFPQDQYNYARAGGGLVAFADGGVAAFDKGADASAVRSLRRHYQSRSEAEQDAMKKGTVANQLGVKPGSPLLDYAFGAEHGGRQITGAGDGLSDDVPAVMDGGQPARLADGEYVISSDAVSALGGGSTKAGSRKLDGMMDRIRLKAHGTKKQVKPVSEKDVLPA